MYPWWTNPHFQVIYIGLCTVYWALEKYQLLTNQQKRTNRNHASPKPIRFLLMYNWSSKYIEGQFVCLRFYVPLENISLIWRRCGDILVLSPLHIMSSATVHAGTGRAYCRPKAYRRDVIFLPCIYSRRRQYVPKSVAYCRSCLQNLLHCKRILGRIFTEREREFTNSN